MFLTPIVLVSLAAFSLGEPIPQAAATTDPGSAPTDSFNSPSESAALASISSLESLMSGMPTLDPSAASVLESAVPTGIYTGQTCQTTTPAWYYSLPADVKSAISSYDSAFASWYAIHSTDLHMTVTLPDNICAGTIFISGSGSVSTTMATATGSASAGHTTGMVTATATGGAATGKAGSATGSAGSATGTAASGTAGVSAASSKAAAPRATGAVGISFAGVVGVLGLIVAL